MNGASDAETLSRPLPYTAIVVAVILWGGSFAAMRSGIGEIGAFGLMSLRSLTAFAVILPFVPRFVRSFRSSYRRSDGPLLILTVLLQPCLYFLFESNALRFTTASQAGVVSATAPILTAFGALIILKEPFEGRTAVGMAMAVLGIAVITFGGGPGDEAFRPLLGNGLELAAMICAAGNIIAVRRLSRRYDTWLLTALQTTAGALFFLPGLIPVIRSGTAVADLPIPAVLYLAVGSTLGAFGLYNWAMKSIPAARASSFINLVPVVSAVGAWTLLGERLTPLQMAGGMTVLSGVILSQRKKRFLSR